VTFDATTLGAERKTLVLARHVFIARLAAAAVRRPHAFGAGRACRRRRTEAQRHDREAAEECVPRDALAAVWSVSNVLFHEVHPSLLARDRSPNAQKNADTLANRRGFVAQPREDASSVHVLSPCSQADFERKVRFYTRVFYDVSRRLRTTLENVRDRIRLRVPSAARTLVAHEFPPAVVRHASQASARE